MDAVNGYLRSHQVILHALVGTVGLAVTLTAYAFTNFSTKVEENQHYSQLEKSIDDVKMDLRDLIKMELKRRK